MKLRLKERIFLWALPIALAGVLMVLAELQYRWSGEVSDAASTRMQAQLQNALLNFRQDLASDLVRMCLEMQTESGAVDAKSLVQKLERWQRTTSHPGLIANMYLWDTSSQRKHSSLLQLSLAENEFKEITWPSGFAELRQIVSPFGQERQYSPPADSAVHPGALRGTGANGNLPQNLFPAQIPWLIDQSIPLLILPASRSRTPELLLIELNINVLQQRVFPQLAERYLGDSRTSEYEVAVVGGAKRRRHVLYSSDAGFAEGEQIRADGALNLFGPPTMAGGSSASVSNFGIPYFPAQRRASALAPQESGHDRFGPVHFDPLQGANEQDWRIVAKHRKGSMEAAVADLRVRNLTLSFGVLLVLGASMALIMFNSQRARRLATLQMDFVAGISHELRTPVAAILSVGENMSDGVVKNSEQLVRYGNIVTNQATRLNHLLEQVLRFSATRKKALSYRVRLLQISDVMSEAMESTAPLLASAGFSVERDLEPNLPAVAADFGMLSQCLQNLITNAVKYGKAGKWLAIRAHSVGEGSSIQEVDITVEDRGIGIDTHEMKQIFEPFYRSPSVIGSQVHGTGLGLALARSFAEAMGGRLTVRSELGKGSAFTIHLPVADIPVPKNTSAGVAADRSLS